MENEPSKDRLKTPQELPLVATPAGTHWREFRVRYLPVLVFSATIFSIWFVWKRVPPSSGLRGVGEGPVSTIASPHDGFIKQIAVPPRGWVEAGQALITIVPFDPGARLDLLQSQLQLSRLSIEPSVADRNALNYEQLRVDFLRLKQELAMAEANLKRAQTTLPRHETLMQEQLLSRDIYEQTLRDLDLYTAEVREKKKAVAEIDARLEELRAMSPTEPGVNRMAQELIPALETQMAAIRTNYNPVVLEAPISGEVNFIRQAGEFVRAGELILVINSARADHVVAYLKPPMPFDPEVGMQMEVTTRSARPQRFYTEIARVGARVEVITNALAYVPAGALVDVGLPLVLPVPENVQVRPGEIVEVDWLPVGTNSTFFQRLFRE